MDTPQQTNKKHFRLRYYTNITEPDMVLENIYATRNNSWLYIKDQISTNLIQKYKTKISNN